MTLKNLIWRKGILFCLIVISNVLVSSQEFVPPEQITLRFITVPDTVRIRAEPTNNSPAVTTLRTRDGVTFLRQVNGKSITVDSYQSSVWYQVQTTDDIVGYVWSGSGAIQSETNPIEYADSIGQFLAQSLPEILIGRYVVADRNVVVRSQPSRVTGDVISGLQIGQSAVYLGTVAGQRLAIGIPTEYSWHRILLPDREIGYVWSGFTSLVFSEPQTANQADITRQIDMATAQLAFAQANLPPELVAEIQWIDTTNNHFFPFLGISPDEYIANELSNFTQGIVFNEATPETIQISIIPIAFEQSGTITALILTSSGELVEIRLRPLAQFLAVDLETETSALLDADSITDEGLQQDGEIIIEANQQIILEVVLSGEAVRLTEDVWQLSMREAIEQPDQINSDFGTFIFVAMGY